MTPHSVAPLAPGERGAALLNAAQRADALDRMAEGELDLLVVGGGVVGAGAALDAATRGLRVGLVEASDYAAGTSSRSSKLVHGGLRYLEQLEFGLVREALRERSLILQRLAPHLARPVPFLYPLRHRFWERFYVGSGITLYDALGRRSGVPGHRHLSKRRAKQAFPALRDDALIGAIQYFDGQVDDARHTLGLIRTAVHYGALCASSSRVTALLREGARVIGVEVQDLEARRQLHIRAKHVINATGVWTADTEHLLGQPASTLSVRASKGIHIVVPRSRIDGSTGIISRTADSVVLLIPWKDHWIIGTTDTDWNLDRVHPAATRADIAYLLAQANALLVDPLTTDDVVGVYVGLRPLLADDSKASSNASREHAIVTARPGLTLIAGGKYTTYRVMAAQVVDQAVAAEALHAAPSCTDEIPLVGATGYRALWNQREGLAASTGLARETIAHLLQRYGCLTHDLIDLIGRDPALGAPLPGAPRYLQAEVVYAVLAEGALHLDDVLTRRLRVSIEVPDRGAEAATHAAVLMAPVLGWDSNTVAREVAHYLARVAAERDSQRADDDVSADAARRNAPDVRMSAFGC